MKKSKREREEDEDGEKKSSDEDESISCRDEEEALIALIDHRSNEVQHLKTRVLYYQSQLEQAEQRLQDSEGKLARVRRKAGKKSRESSLPITKEVKVERRSVSPSQTSKDSTQHRPQSKPQLLISSVSVKSMHPKAVIETRTRAPSCDSSPSESDSPVKDMLDRSHTAPRECDNAKIQAVCSKRKAEHREHNELVRMVSSSSSPSLIQCNTSTYVSSQHKRKLRSLALCPVSDKLFVTSALDGMIHVWQLQGNGSGATCVSSTSCLSPNQRRWPEDIAWHPEGDRLIAVYTAGGGDNQISTIDFNKNQSDRVTFLEEKPHVKGVINSITFMPWDGAYFATGGSDHAVVFWSEKDADNMWKPKTLHRNLHSSAVTGVSGLQHKHMVVSVGADKRIIGYDVLADRADFKHQIDSKCMSVVSNPRDFNLFVVQAGTPGMQLRLFDIRERGSELHSFGWKQESSEQLSALVSQAWSPDGLYISSGSADPIIHIFDIRYNSGKPSQSLKAHRKRVFKAEWHKSSPLLISISSDLNIGLHPM